MNQEPSETKLSILTPQLTILASAGSGKTYKLVNRVIGLVVAGLPPEKIVALTFTRKAAGEFTDTVLTRLAEAIIDNEKAAKLREDIAQPDADLPLALEKILRVLPRMTLGTMDSFFAKIVRSFQYELGLTGGKFDLIEGSRAEVMKDEILTSILGQTLTHGDADDFLHAFRRATIGKEDQGVLKSLHAFVETWHALYRSSSDLEWGPARLARAQIEDWEKQKHDLIAKVRRGLAHIEFNDKRQQPAFEKMIESLAAHTIGSGSIGTPTSLLLSSMNACQHDGPLRVKLYKDFIIGGPAGDALRQLIHLAANCELAAALHRTRAIHEIIKSYDEHCEKKLRNRGLLGFDDIKILMGEWVNGGDAENRRDLIDFRLDARYDHWLLDEFQDTSREQWLGIKPLLDENIGDTGRGLFVVGDKKQAIYGWRGGDVSLFDDVLARPQMESQTMADSHRSSPEVLTLVNQVCGDIETIRHLFGEAADRWQWEDHQSVAHLTNNERRGEARVEVIDGTWDEKIERLCMILTELEIGKNSLTCGILVTSNDKVRELADTLRERGHTVIEEGKRKPAQDHFVGITLSHLLKWLSNPADVFARELIEMTPLATTLRQSFGESWDEIWNSLLELVSSSGFFAMMQDATATWQVTWSEADKHNVNDLFQELAALDARGTVTIREAADSIERLEVSESPGAGAIQVMTIHKSKGLGFDVVILPDIPTKGIPESNRFKVAHGPGWLTQTPPKWARDLIPEIRKAEEAAAITQRYEALCKLYVALTRAKRGLYILLEKPSAKADETTASLANWLSISISSQMKDNIYQEGRADWIKTLATGQKKPECITQPSPLHPPISRRQRLTPSHHGDAALTASTHSGLGIAFGTEVHAIIEKIGWLDESYPSLPDTEAGRLVTRLLNVPRLRQLFLKADRSVRLLREQPINAIIQGKWLSGSIDRLHLHLDSVGAVSQITLIDFKTDAIDDLSILAEKYAPQLHAYRQALTLAYPTATIQCLLLSTHCQDWVEVY